MGLIYLLKNKVNGKCYIGQTIRSFKKRLHEHLDPNDGCTALVNAIKKYTFDSFETSILENDVDDELLDDLETKYIKKYDSLCPNGYNIQTGGSKGKKHCPESRERMRIAKLGEKNFNFGKPRTDITKQRISDAKKGEKHHFYGKHLSDEHKLNLSKAHKKEDLPIYLVHIKARPQAHQSEGYGIANHPIGKNKWFTSKTLTLDEKYKSALEHLNKLNSLL